jgi:outer membrane protein TolC
MSSPAPACAWIAVCALAWPAGALAQERSAQDVIDAILRDGPRAIAIRAEVDVVRLEQQARLAFPNPAVSYSREGAGFTEFLQVEQSLPIFGVRSALDRAGVAAGAASEAERDARLWDLRVEATRIVSRWLWAQSRLEMAQADTKAVAGLIEVLRVREREGEGSRFDRLRTEQELAELEQAAVAAAVEVADARGAVAALLPAATTVTRVTGAFAATGTVPDVEALILRAHTSRAELRALQFGLERSTLEADAARRARRPAPLVSGGLKRADTAVERENGGVFGLSLAVPLFDTGAREAARWTAEATRVAAERAAIEQQVRADILRASDALSIRQRALESSGQDAVGAELVATAGVAYREGEIGIVALLDAVRTASRARVRDLERRLDVRLAQIALERAVGEVLWP